MPFSFLNPWLWMGGLAIAAPIYLHLRRRKEPNLLRFSAVRFLQDQSRARHSPWTVRDLFLLMLRSFAVLLIVAGFTWPYWRSAASPARESVVYILDNTLSRQANNGFSSDRERFLRDLESARPGVQIAVIQLTSSPRVVAGFEADRTVAMQKVQELQPSFQRGSYLAAFRLASSLLSEATGQRKRIILLGDNQANQWAENVSAPPFLRDVDVELPKISQNQLPNLWLADPQAQRVFLGDDSKLTFSMLLGHSGPAGTATVVLRVNGKMILNREVDLENRPRTLRIQAECQADPSAWSSVEAQVHGTPDALEPDNHLYYSVPPVKEGRVALLASSPYLRLALSPEVMRGQWTSRFLDPSQLEPELGVAPKADVLCLETSYLQSGPARSLLNQYLAAGGGVLLVVDRLSPAIDGCLRELGFEADGMVNAAEGQSATFQFVFANHSIFQPFQSPDFGNLMDVRISRYARLRPIAARPLIISQSGTGLFFEGTKFRGKLFVCAFGLQRDQTTWPVHPTFIPFLDLALQAARPHEEAPTCFQPGDVTIVRLPDGSSAHELVLSQNDTEVQRTQVENGTANLRLPSRPGLYELTYDGQKAIQRIFSVNVPPDESELLFTDSPKNLDAWLVRTRSMPGGFPFQTASAVGYSAILLQHVWWWMILGSLLALALETVFAGPKGERI